MKLLFGGWHAPSFAFCPFSSSSPDTRETAMSSNSEAVTYLPSSHPSHKVVVLDYNHLVADSTDFSKAIEEAFGFDGLGLLTVKNVPNQPSLRNNLLPLAHRHVTDRSS